MLERGQTTVIGSDKTGTFCSESNDNQSFVALGKQYDDWNRLQNQWQLVNGQDIDVTRADPINTDKCHH